MSFVERVQTVIVDEATGQVVAPGVGYATLRRREALSSAQAAIAPVRTPVTVTGIAAVGEDLTAVLDDNWAVTGYQWYADGVVIVGATAATYTVTVAEQGKEISVGVTGLTFKSGIVAIPADVEAVGTLVVVGFVVGTTDVVEGTTLTATLTATDADGAITIAYKWQEDIAGTWTDIVGATAAAFEVPLTTYVGKDIRVVATTTDVNGATTAFVGTAYTVIAA